MKSRTFLSHRTARLLGAGLAIGAADIAGAETITVTTTSDDDGTHCSAVMCTLRSAVHFANDNDEIVFAPTLSYPATIRLDAALEIMGKRLSIRHPERGAVTLDGRMRHRILEIHPDTHVTIGGLHLANGRHEGVSATGGCVRIDPRASLTLIETVVSDCLARGTTGSSGTIGSTGQSGIGGSIGQDGSPGAPGRPGGDGGVGGGASGGAIYVAGQLVLVDSSLVRNAAIGGKGGDGGTGGTGGRGGNGGASGGATGWPGNGGNGGDGGPGGKAGAGGGASGGAVYVNGPNARIEALNVVIAANVAEGGSDGEPGDGGVGGDGGSGGRGGDSQPGASGRIGAVGAGALAGAARGGGFASSEAARGVLSFVTVVENRARAGRAGPSAAGAADGYGGGIGGSYSGIELRNSMLAGNAVQDSSWNAARLGNCNSLPVLASGTNMSDSGDCSGVTAQPWLGALYDDGGTVPVVMLEVDSPAIDAAIDCAILQDRPELNATDIRGAARPQDGDGYGGAHCDIGAYEADAIVGDEVFRDGFDA